MAKGKAPSREEQVAQWLDERGIAYSDRQLAWCVAFCTPGASLGHSTKAAVKAGYPDAETNGDDCYAMFGSAMDALIEQEKTRRLAVWRVLDEAMKAESVKEIVHEGVVLDEVRKPDHRTRLDAAKQAANMLGLNAPTKTEAHVVTETYEDRLKRLTEGLKP